MRAEGGIVGLPKTSPVGSDGERTITLHPINSKLITGPAFFISATTWPMLNPLIGVP
jgi:hypothetical protein